MERLVFVIFQKNLAPSNANTKLEGYSRFQETELYPAGIGAEHQQAETRHFRSSGNAWFCAFVYTKALLAGIL